MGRHHQGVFVARLGGGLVGRSSYSGPPGRNRTPDSGMVIVETAVGLLAVTFVAILLVGAIGVGLYHARVLDAARSGARVAARGEGDGSIRQQAIKSFENAQVSVGRSGDEVEVRVTVVVKLGPLVPEFRISKSAIALNERTLDPQ